jgi:hypothetical protein
VHITQAAEVLKAEDISLLLLGQLGIRFLDIVLTSSCILLRSLRVVVVLMVDSRREPGLLDRLAQLRQHSDALLIQLRLG